MVSGSLPVQVLLGIYLGILSGIVPALVAGVLGFVFRYVTDVTVPGFGVVVLGLAIAGANGGLLALNDPAIVSAENSATFIVAIVVVLMLTLFAHAQGDALGASLPKRVTLRSLADRTLSTDVVELVGGRNQVRVRAAGAVADMEGYPPLPAELRADIRDATWTFPADVPLPELETRLADRLRTEYDLADVTVTLDERARATITAAPPVGGLSKRVPSGTRAVSLDAIVPTGLAPGESVRLLPGEAGEAVTGTVVSAVSGGAAPSDPAPDLESGVAPDGGAPDADGEGPAPAAPVTAGGEGRITVAVDRAGAVALLRRDRGRVVVLSRGTGREFELTTLLRRAGQRFRRLTVEEGGPLDGSTIADAGLRDTYGVAVLAVRNEGRWQVAPRGETPLEGGQELYVVGPRENLDRFAEVAS